MYTIEMCVCKATDSAPEVITDEAAILELAGLDPRAGLHDIALQADGPGVVLDKKGRYGELRHGYFVTYEEVPFTG